MKRSDVVLTIAQCLIEPHFPDDPKKEASYILMRLEKNGMLPPIEPGRTIYDLDLGIPEWEPEDEGS